MRVAYLEDDPDQAALVGHWLHEADHECHHFATGAALLASIGELAPDLLMLDWQLPDMTGEAVMHAVIERCEQTPPIVLLTAHTEAEDLVRVLRAGANDHIPKPAKRLDLLRRIAAFEPEPKTAAVQDILSMPPYLIDRIALTVTAHEAAVNLGEAEFEVDLNLFEAVEQIVTLPALAENVARVTGARPSTRDVQGCVARVRAKLRLTAASGWQLRTVTNIGYRLEAVR